jgi:hypothetical protein
LVTAPTAFFAITAQDGAVEDAAQLRSLPKLS